MEENIWGFRDMAGRKSRSSKMARWLIDPLWRFEAVDDFINVSFILFELVENFFHEIGPSAMLGGDISHFVDEVLVSDGTFNCLLSKENWGKKGDKAYAYVIRIFPGCCGNVSLG